MELCVLSLVYDTQPDLLQNAVRDVLARSPEDALAFGCFILRMRRPLVNE